MIIDANQQSRREKGSAPRIPFSLSPSVFRPSSAAFNEVSTSPAAFRMFSPDTFIHLSHVHTHICTRLRISSDLAYSFPPPSLPFPTLNPPSRLETVGFSILPRCSLSHCAKQKPRNRKALENSGHLSRITAMFRGCFTTR